MISKSSIREEILRCALGARLLLLWLTDGNAALLKLRLLLGQRSRSADESAVEAWSVSGAQRVLHSAVAHLQLGVAESALEAILVD